MHPTRPTALVRPRVSRVPVLLSALAAAALVLGGLSRIAGDTRLGLAAFCVLAGSVCALLLLLPQRVSGRALAVQRDASDRGDAPDRVCAATVQIRDAHLLALEEVGEEFLLVHLSARDSGVETTTLDAHARVLASWREHSSGVTSLVIPALPHAREQMEAWMLIGGEVSLRLWLRVEADGTQHPEHVVITDGLTAVQNLPVPAP